MLQNMIETSVSFVNVVSFSLKNKKSRPELSWRKSNSDCRKKGGGAILMCEGPNT